MDNPDLMVDVFAFRGNEVIKMTMTHDESQRIKKAKGWNYGIFQSGWNTTIPTKTMENNPKKPA